MHAHRHATVSSVGVTTLTLWRDERETIESKRSGAHSCREAEAGWSATAYAHPASNGRWLLGCLIACRRLPAPALLIVVTHCLDGPWHVRYQARSAGLRPVPALPA